MLQTLASDIDIHRDSESVDRGGISRTRKTVLDSVADSAIITDDNLGARKHADRSDAVASFFSTKPAGGAGKRFFDFSLALLAILATLPLLAVIALVCVLSGRPTYSQVRVGYGGRTFKCHKFRTMVEDADVVLAKLLQDDPKLAKLWETHRKLPNDPRVTRAGRILRKSSLDELPQLFNILKGDMSFVGPRPPTLDELDDFWSVDKGSLYRVRPGLTGLWQISGRNEVSFAERVRLDLEYIEKWSFWKDLSIMARTPAALLKFKRTH